MDTGKYLKISVFLTLAGACFSGYLSAVKLFSGSCAFGESCPIFLGQPACYYGFAVFLAMLVGTAVAYFRRVSSPDPIKFNLALSALGIVFSGSFVVQEIAVWVRYGFRATFFGLSTCAYGLIFFAAIFAFSLCVLKCRGGYRSVAKGRNKE
ncbi:hypothetical protein JW899_02100 [Candidatus Uhrbacteria bacterium]|nr:hypothetical protein [Candidatus Uhrbacteria bacterium]